MYDFINKNLVILFFRQVNKKQNFGLKLNVLYSTPSCYLKAVNDEGIIYDTKFDDFFPYANNSKAIWTGFYTSRPSLKLYERKANNFLQVCICKSYY